MSSSSSDNIQLVYNARIWQSAGADVTWMTFNTVSGYITAVGRHDPPLDKFPPNRRRDASDSRIIPGLHDSHLHVTLLGRQLRSVDLRGCQSIEELQQRVRNFAAERPGAAWIVGHGWEQHLLGRLPTRHDLDAAVSDRPVHLSRVCYHASVENSLAIKLAGIDRLTTDPDDGRIDRDRDGQPTGLLLEKARDIIHPLLTESVDEVAEYISDAVQLLLRHGVTSAHACEDGTWLSFCRLADQGRLPLRVFYSAFYDTSRDDTSYPAAGSTYGEMLSCDRVKLFVDGALGANTAALSQPYCNSDGSEQGILTMTQDEMTSRVAMATSSGYRVEMHVIGDRAVDVALNALRDAHVPAGKRPVFIHCQILRDEQLAKMREHGVIASIQPQFVPTDAAWLSSKLPQQLMSLAYPWKSLLEAGIVCAGGSDAPVELPQPLLGIYDCIFRPAGNRCETTRQFKDMHLLANRIFLETYQVRPGFLPKSGLWELLKQKFYRLDAALLVAKPTASKH